ncbi:1433_t:CDS:2 [Ambispora gerdemannii]|uniref:1433_t:CDS:1 n=1 Tax=Ambispora gerdemannii TaxID=144530 RepID=A0A9N8WLU1_9GLOM|nr:1433_t:CDS:2 [Ambispora gerdemannii]
MSQQTLIKSQSRVPTLPSECITEILKSVPSKDISTLFTCLLINRQWYLNTIRILWKDPFGLLLAKRGQTTASVENWRLRVASLLDTYLLFLEQEDHQTLEQQEIILPKRSSSNSNVDYVGIMQNINVDQILDGVHCCSTRKVEKRRSGGSDGNGEYPAYFDRLASEHLITQMILKLFVRKCESLKVFGIENIRDNFSLNTVLVHPNSSANLANLVEFTCVSTVPGISDILSSLAQISRRLKKIKIWQYPVFTSRVHSENLQLASLIELITAQKRLEELDLGYLHPNMDLNTICDAIASQSKTFRRLSLTCVSTSRWTSLAGLSVCENFQSFEAHKCKGVFTPEWAEEITSLTFPRIKCLNISTNFPYETFKEILCQSNKNIETIIIGHTAFKSTEETRDALSTIADNCPNLQNLQAYFLINELECVTNLFDFCPNLKRLNLLGSLISQQQKQLLTQLYQLMATSEHLQKLENLRLKVSVPFDPAIFNSLLKTIPDTAKVEIYDCTCYGGNHLDVMVECMASKLRSIHFQIHEGPIKLWEKRRIGANRAKCHREKMVS